MGAHPKLCKIAHESVLRASQAEVRGRWDLLKPNAVIVSPVLHPPPSFIIAGMADAPPDPIPEFRHPHFVEHKHDPLPELYDAEGYPVIEFAPVPQLRRRRVGWDEARQRAFIALLARTPSVGHAARAVGLSARSAYRRRPQSCRGHGEDGRRSASRA